MVTFPPRHKSKSISERIILYLDLDETRNKFQNLECLPPTLDETVSVLVESKIFSYSP